MCRGRKWTTKQGDDVYFVSLNAWRIEAEAAQDSTPFAPAAEPPVGLSSFESRTAILK